MTILSILFSALAAPFLFGSGAVGLFGCTAARPTLPGLLFHSITLKRSLALSVLSLPRFEAIVLALKTNDFVSLTLQEAAEYSSGSPASALRPVLLTFDDGCRSFFTQALPVLESAGFKATLFPVAGYLGSSSSWDVMPRFDHLTKNEVREISSLGHEIGSHSLTHPNLTYLGDSDLTRELQDSKRLLEDITGKSVTAISFPFGCWNKRVWKRAQEIGYTHGTIYRNHAQAARGLHPVYGAYRFDSTQRILARLAPAHSFSLSAACARIMSHFAKGSSMWKFRTHYRLLP